MNKKISLITVVYNGIEFIEQTILSVLSQSYPNIEYIIIDGGSKDGTLDIIKKYDERISFWKTESDNGIYDAMNKGLHHTTGDVIGFINADDYYNSNDSIMEVMNHFNYSETDICYGDCIQVDRINPNKIIRYWQSGKFKKNKYCYGWYPPHPSFFVKRKIYDELGAFDLSLRIASDVDLMLRFLISPMKSVVYLPKTIVNVRAGGLSNKNIINIFKLNIEIWNCLKKYQLNKSILHYIFGKVFSRLSQYLKLGYKS